jgi:alpha-glucosidase
VPLPWTADAPGFGFGPADAAAPPWLPQPPVFADLAVDRQAGDPDSTLELYRTVLGLRRELRTGEGRATVDTPASAGDADIVTVTVTTPVTTVTVCTNTGTRPWTPPAGARVVLATTPGVTTRVPPDCTVWLTGLGSRSE